MRTTPATILIVDDELLNRRLLQALLQPEGYLTRCAGSGSKALASVRRNAPDLILLDVVMPEIDGFEVARRLKADPHTAQIPIIMVTVQNDREARLAGLEAGAEDFLAKPVDRAELWLRVRNLLRLKTFNDYLRNHAGLLEQQVQARTVELQRFRTAMDATAEAIFLINRDTMRFVEVNATACSMLGYAHGELVQMGPAQLGTESLEQLASAYDLMIARPGKHDLAELYLRRKDGSQVQVEMNCQAHRSGEDWIIVGVARDLTERTEGLLRLHHLAHYDALTGLPNRTLFHDTLTRTMALAHQDGWQLGVLFIDLDHFKDVNDRLGHAIGDELLVQVSNRLVSCLRVRDTVGRLGGDEFSVILLLRQDGPGAMPVATKIQKALRAPFDLKGHDVAVTASIGIALCPGDASDTETLLRYADTAMYRAKQAGRDTFRFFTAQMNAEVVARIELESALRTAVDKGEFILHYQPQMDLDTGRLSGVEALLRWERPGHGLVEPNEFIPVLEETGLIRSVGSWVIATVCGQIRAWIDGGVVQPVRIAVNVSAHQFVGDDLEADVTRALADNGIPPELLELELTESTLMAHTERTAATLANLKMLGVHVSIDDFGTGYSSLAYLRRFPIDKLKIDIAFVHDIGSVSDDGTIAVTIIRLAHSLGLVVIAEGVETAVQLAYLQRHGCNQIQGFYFSPPLTLPELERLLRENAASL